MHCRVFNDNTYVSRYMFDMFFHTTLSRDSYNMCVLICICCSMQYIIYVFQCIRSLYLTLLRAIRRATIYFSISALQKPGPWTTPCPPTSWTYIGCTWLWKLKLLVRWGRAPCFYSISLYINRPSYKGMTLGGSTRLCQFSHNPHEVFEAKAPCLPFHV